MKNWKIFLSLFFANTIFYLPVFLNNKLLLDRNNDLTQFFWPIFYFSKTKFIETGELPLWNNLFLSGTPLLPDPQAPLFYLPNVIFLIFPIDLAFILSFFLHTLVGGIAMYLLTRSFKISPLGSIFASILYMSSPKLVSHIEAGHFGLVAAYSWIPFVGLFLLKIKEKPNYLNSLFLSVSLAALFYTHLPTFLISVSFVLITLLLLTIRKKNGIKTIVFFSLLTFLLLFGLTAIALLPQLEWKDFTSRVLLNADHDIYPKWLSLEEFLQSLFFPWYLIKDLNTEKIITIGLFPSLFAFYGLLKNKKGSSLAILAVLFSFGVISLNNISPLRDFISQSEIIGYIRVVTRIWFIPNLFILLLAAYGFDKIIRSYNKKIIYILAVLALLEFFALWQLRVGVEQKNDNSYAPIEIYEFLKSDPERFRVFCVTRCLSQKTAAEYDLQLVEGYSTLQQANYFEYFIQLSQVYWNKYTLTLPPMSIYHFREIQPHSPTIAEYNIKYVIAPYPLKDPGLNLEKRIGDYFIYRNSLVLPRAFFLSTGNGFLKEAEIIEYSPNHIKINTEEKESLDLILAEIWSPGWVASLNGETTVEILETSSKLRKVTIKEDTKFVDFIYNPRTYQIGKIITLATLIIIILAIFSKLLNKINAKK